MASTFRASNPLRNASLLSEPFLMDEIPFHTVEFEGFVTWDVLWLRDQTGTTFGPKVNCVRQVDY